MGALSVAIAFGVRLLLVLLFLPFSALDKILDFRGAIAQAEQDVSSTTAATALIGVGLFIEVVMSAGVLTGIADRAAALVLGLYCIATALLWKQFWRPGDFWAGSHSRARALFWGFWKNIALAGGFLLITFGTSAGSVGQFFANPLSSTHPYSTDAEVTTMNESVKPRVSYWHLWTDPSGMSRQTRCAMTEFDLKGISSGVAPQWQGNKTSAESTVFVSVLPVGWTADWHENPKPQWIIPLSGRWFVESMDGQRVEFGPGKISFGEDQNTKEADGRKGHRSGTVGNTPAVLMIVQFDSFPQSSSPCRFR
jgi:uncharacterized membrane protein YphA (DoxX/SURF4 family)